MDDADYGLNLTEERKIQAYNNFHGIVSAFCVIGLWTLPLTGANDTNTKLILVLLYLFILCLDCSMLDVELKECSNRRLHWNLTLSSGPEKVALDCLSAWWNYHSDSEGKVAPFKSYRQLADASGVGRYMCTKDEDVIRTKHEENELVFLPPTSGMGDDGVHYVNGQVALMWEDTDLELVVPNGEMKAGDESVTRWIKVDAQDQKEDDLAPRAENGAFICPWLRASSEASGQTLQQKMILVAQAGASGLIFGQRGIDYLSPGGFGTAPVVPAELWKGTYSVIDGGEKNCDNFATEYIGSVYDERVVMGCAVNSVLINSLDMQELVWSLHERMSDGEGADADTCAAAKPIVVSTCHRKKQLVAVHQSLQGTSAVSRFSLQHDRIHKNFRHVMQQQRQILACVSPKAVDELAFLTGVRTWITTLWITNLAIYPLLHLLTTWFVLQVVLELSLMMYRQLNVNNSGHVAVMVLFVSLLNGFNTSYFLNWWPKLFTAKPSQIEKTIWGRLGQMLTSLVILQYFGVAIGMFVYFGVIEQMNPS